MFYIFRKNKIFTEFGVQNCRRFWLKKSLTEFWLKTVRIFIPKRCSERSGERNTLRSLWNQKHLSPPSDFQKPIPSYVIITFFYPAIDHGLWSPATVCLKSHADERQPSSTRPPSYRSTGTSRTEASGRRNRTAAATLLTRSPDPASSPTRHPSGRLNRVCESGRHEVERRSASHAYYGWAPLSVKGRQSFAGGSAWRYRAAARTSVRRDRTRRRGREPSWRADSGSGDGKRGTGPKRTHRKDENPTRPTTDLCGMTRDDDRGRDDSRAFSSEFAENVRIRSTVRTRTRRPRKPDLPSP